MKTNLITILIISLMLLSPISLAYAEEQASEAGMVQEELDNEEVIIQEETLAGGEQELSISSELISTDSSEDAPYAVQPILPKHIELNSQGSYQTSLYSGAATYSYNFKIPPGINGLQPIISLQYNSQSSKDANTLIADGWKLSQSYIEEDTTPGKYYKLVLNGEEYELTKSKYDSFDRYRTKIESYFHIKKLYGGNNNKGRYWKIRTKDGTEYRFGYKKESELVSNQDNYVIRWSLDQVTDTSGNKIFYSYNEDESNGVAYPNRIEYNNDQSKRVRFVYENLQDNKVIYENDNKIDIRKRLASIYTYRNSAMIEGYHFYYDNPNKDSSLTFLNKIIVPEGDIRFDYTNSEDLEENLEDISSNWNFPPNLFLHQGFEYEDETETYGLDPGVILMDINGDGFADLVKIYCDDNVGDCLTDEDDDIVKEVWINNRQGWEEENRWHLPDVPFSDWDSRDAGVRITDLNNDGLPDIIQRYKHKYIDYRDEEDFKRTRVWINKYGHFSGESWDFPDDEYFSYGYDEDDEDFITTSEGLMLIDINNDQYPDLVKSYCYDAPDDCYDGDSPIERKVWINNQRNGWNLDTSWNFPKVPFWTKWDPGARFADINGDGLTDILVLYIGTRDDEIYEKAYLNTGTEFKDHSSDWNFPGVYFNMNNDDQALRLIDVNGDGLLDLMQSYCTENTEQCNKNNPDYTHGAVWINTGNGWDYNNDWKVDRIGIPFVSELKGTGKGRSRTKQTNSGSRVIDINGDGLSDILRIYRDTERPRSNSRIVRKLMVNPNKNQNLLKTITNQHGGKVEIEYKESVSFDNNEEKSNDLPFNIWVVSKITKDDNFKIHSTIYEYKHGKYNFEEKEFRGFGEVNQYDVTKTTYKFHQDDAKKGKLYHLITPYNSNRLTKEKYFSWSSSESNGIFTLKLDAENEWIKENEKILHQVRQFHLYDDYGNLRTSSILLEESDGGTTFEYYDYTYNENKWIVDKVKKYRKVSKGKEISSIFSYDDLEYGESPTKGLLTKQEDSLETDENPLTTYNYNNHGNVIQETNPRGFKTTYDYDITNTYPKKITNALQQEFNYEYDPRTGNILSETDPNGFKTKYKYDSKERLIKEIREYDNEEYPTTEYIYKDNINPKSIIKKQREEHNQPGTLDNYYYYNGFGKLIQYKREGENKFITIDTSYDSIGRIKKISNPYYTEDSNYNNPKNTKGFEYEYDELNRITKVKNPDNTEKNIKFNKRIISVYDEKNNQIDYILNAYDQIVEVKEYNEEEVYSTTYKYDILGNIVEIVDSQDNKISYEYDSLGRKTKETDPDIGTWNYKYDLNGNMKEQEDARGKITTIIYDDLDRKEKVETNENTIEYFYDVTKGTLSKVKDTLGTVEYLYDKRRRIIEENRNDIPDSKITIKYDALDRIKSKEINNNKITYIYNDQGKIESINGIINNIDYNELDQPIKKEYSNGLTTNLDYYEDNFKIAQIITGIQQHLAYEYDSAGNLIWMLDTAIDSVYSMNYDNLNRLIKVKRLGIFSYDLSYIYDKIGNLLSVNYNGVTKNLKYEGRAYTPKSLITESQVFSISSPPPSSILRLRQLHYSPLINGVNHKSELEYHLVKGPEEATYESNLLRWTPELHDAGKTFDFEIKIVNKDTQETATQNFQVEVKDKTLHISDSIETIEEQSKPTSITTTNTVVAVDKLQEIASNKPKRKSKKENYEEFTHEIIPAQEEKPKVLEYVQWQPSNKEEIKEKESFFVRMFKKVFKVLGIS